MEPPSISEIDNETYVNTFYLGIGLFVFAFFGGLVIDSPYGKMANKLTGGGIELDPRFGWWLMELPATLSFIYFYFIKESPNAFSPVPLFVATLFLIHYSNRGWYFPLNIRVHPGSKASFGFVVMFVGFFFTTLHGYLNARWFNEIGVHLTTEWLTDPRFIVGFLLYEFSLITILHCEWIMRNLRTGKPGEPRYKIPRGGWFELLTSPQYTFELTAWMGWAIMTWSPAGLVVFLVSAANLIPRTFSSHKWYLNKFEDYPRDRKIIIPYVL